MRFQDPLVTLALNCETRNHFGMCSTCKAKPKSRRKQRLCGRCNENFTPVTGEAGIYVKNMEFWICGDCEEYFEYCAVCNDYWCTDWEEPCRHLFWNKPVGMWDGPGKFYSKKDRDAHKETFLRFLGLVDPKSWEPMRAAIASGTLRTMDWGSMIGPSHLEVRFGDYLSVDFISESKLKEQADYDAIWNGVGLLRSLDKKTADVNKAVARWVGEKIRTLKLLKKGNKTCLT